jgi:phospholipase D1/2
LQGKRNRYSSFRPPHASIPAQWYVDGEDTYEAIADAIESARNCIFVADWFLIIETYLRRKHPPSIHNRFDKMILKKAQEVRMLFVCRVSCVVCANDVVDRECISMCCSISRSTWR